MNSKFMKLRSMVKAKSAQEKEGNPGAFPPHSQATPAQKDQPPGPRHSGPVTSSSSSATSNGEGGGASGSSAKPRGFSGPISRPGGLGGLLSRTASLGKDGKESSGFSKSATTSGASTKSSSISSSSGVPKSGSTSTTPVKSRKAQTAEHSRPPARRSALSQSSDDVRRDAGANAARPQTSAAQGPRSGGGGGGGGSQDSLHRPSTSGTTGEEGEGSFPASASATGTEELVQAERELHRLTTSGRSVSTTRLRRTGSTLGAGDSVHRDVVLGTMEMLTKAAQEHIEKIKAGTAEEQVQGAEALRTMAKMGQRQSKAVVAAGAIGPLTRLLRGENGAAVEHAITTLLNCALDEKVRGTMLESEGFLGSVSHVLVSGAASLQARANAAAALRCVSTLPGARESIVKAGAVPGLLELLKGDKGEPQKDAANCLLSLSISRETRLPLTQSGLIQVLVDLLQDTSFACEEQAAGLFAGLSRIPEGREALFHQGAISPLAELLECGATELCKEYAVTALVGLAVNSKACLVAIDEMGITTSLDVLSRTGSQSAQGKAKGLLELLSQQADG